MALFQAVPLPLPNQAYAMALSSFLNDKNLARFRTKPCERLVAKGGDGFKSSSCYEMVLTHKDIIELKPEAMDALSRHIAAA